VGAGVEFHVEETIPGTEAAQIPKQRGDSLLEAAVRYAEERHWDVFPGLLGPAIP
jgi:hypothetical protein